MSCYYILINYLLVFLLGSIYALAELIGRYSEPKQILNINAGRFYILFNGCISVFALLIVMEFDVDFMHYKHIEAGKILVAGTSAMLVFRSTIASVKIGGKNIEGGLSPIVQVFLDAVNKSYDRQRSKIDLNEVGNIMKNVNYTKAEADLPLLCLNLLRTLPEAEGKNMGVEISNLSQSSASKKAKSINLGIIIARYTGIDLLKKAVDTLGDIIQDGEQEEPNIDELINQFST